MKKKINTCVPNIPSAIRLVPQDDGLHDLEAPDNFAIFSDCKNIVFTNSEKQQRLASREADYLPSTDSSNHKITEGKRNNLLRKLELPENKAELLT